MTSTPLAAALVKTVDNETPLQFKQSDTIWRDCTLVGPASQPDRVAVVLQYAFEGEFSDPVEVPVNLLRFRDLDDENVFFSHLDKTE